jgi:PAS domain S-box-containing protein
VSDDGRSESASVLRSMGLDALVEILENSAYGVCITGDDHTWVYVNRAGEEIIGHPFDEVRGQDYLLHFPEHERAVLLALKGKQHEGDVNFYTNTVLHPDGERSMTWSGTVINVDGAELAPAIFHETTASQEARRRAAQLAGAATSPHLTGRGLVLTELLDETVLRSRATAAVVLLEDDAGRLDVAATSGADPVAAERIAGTARLSDLPGVDALARGRSLFLADAADRMRQRPATEEWPALLSPDRWNGGALFGVLCDGILTGCLLVLLPVSLTAPSQSELEMWASLAEQAGLALGADRLRQHLTESSALSERNRIARDLHDSVSQALFSLQARAQVVRRALDASDLDLAREAAEHLELLSRQATTELRVLVTELRTAGEDRLDLGTALRRVADDVTLLDGLPVGITLRPATMEPLETPVVDHVVRIVGEALHNAVKHAGAAEASLEVEHDGGTLTVRVTDDGAGFNPAAARTGYGQHTMRERARLCGGTLTVESAPGAGTTVALTVPLDGT